MGKRALGETERGREGAGRRGGERTRGEIEGEGDKNEFKKMELELQ